MKYALDDMMSKSFIYILRHIVIKTLILSYKLKIYNIISLIQHINYLSNDINQVNEMTFVLYSRRMIIMLEVEQQEYFGLLLPLRRSNLSHYIIFIISFSLRLSVPCVLNWRNQLYHKTKSQNAFCHRIRILLSLIDC